MSSSQACRQCTGQVFTNGDYFCCDGSDLSSVFVCVCVRAHRRAHLWTHGDQKTALCAVPQSLSTLHSFLVRFFEKESLIGLEFDESARLSGQPVLEICLSLPT